MLGERGGERLAVSEQAAEATRPIRGPPLQLAGEPLQALGQRQRHRRRQSRIALHAGKREDDRGADPRLERLVRPAGGALDQPVENLGRSEPAAIRLGLDLQPVEPLRHEQVG